ncbi:MAG: hypothetical protein QOI35_852 [Cryptosporangiaceae bacterium]|nr:hypothetical protein [Cryptosporangiaceae bacterium]
MIEVLAPGPLATVQDLGRAGYAQLGVGRSGAADRRSHALANRIAGNRPTAATVELTLGGFTARFAADAVLALAGAPVPATAGDRVVPLHEPVRIRAGEVLRIRSPRDGLRTYLAVRGGIGGPKVLGSRSADLLAGIVPVPVRRGSVLAVDTEAAADPRAEQGEALPAELVLRILPGPRDGWFGPGAVPGLCADPYEVGRDSNRVGLRLSGRRLARARPGELPPEGMVPGALQVPPDGQPVLFLADHPVTGGYPVIAVVAEDSLALAAQARPGRAIRFML